MATLGGSRGDRPGNSNHLKSSLVSPEKVRELLNDGVSSASIGPKRCILFGLKGHKNTLTLASFVSHLASQLCYFKLATVRRVSSPHIWELLGQWREFPHHCSFLCLLFGPFACWVYACGVYAVVLPCTVTDKVEGGLTVSWYSDTVANWSFVHLLPGHEGQVKYNMFS